jgi:hypothetical protein
VNPAGAALLLLGVWACAQVFKGDALARLGLVGES